MIISHKYKFIFVKTGKVAGTSVEIALRPYLGDDDIVTPVDSRDEKYAKDNLIPGPQNYGRKHWNEKMKIHDIKGSFYEHAYAYEIKGLIGEKIWNEYFKFTIERDPKDKSLSTYFYNKYGMYYSLWRILYNYYLLHKGSGRETTSSVSTNSLNTGIAKVCSLERWLIEDRIHAFSQNYFRYSINNKVIVDKVFPFSKLNLLQDYLSNLIGSKIEFPRLKSGYRKKSVLSLKEKMLLDKLYENPIFQKEFDILNNFVYP